MFIRTSLLALATVLSIGTASAHGYKVGDLQIEHPWARATPQGAKVGGGFFVVKNAGATADRLVAVSAPDVSDNVQIHEMAVKDGVMTMAPLPNGLDIPAKGSVELKPGSYHVMFIDLKHPLKKGDHVKAKLTFEHAGPIDVDFEVDAIGATSAGHDAGHTMNGMSH